VAPVCADAVARHATATMATTKGESFMRPKNTQFAAFGQGLAMTPGVFACVASDVSGDLLK
jgi:hypothetical protein